MLNKLWDISARVDDKPVPKKLLLNSLTPFEFATRINNAIGLAENGVSVNRLRFEEPFERCFLFIDKLCVRRELLTMVLEGSLDLRLLLVRYSQPRNQSRVGPPCSTGDLVGDCKCVLLLNIVELVVQLVQLYADALPSRIL